MQEVFESVGIFIIDSNEDAVVLGVAMDGSIEYPGGKREGDETPRQTILNELVEELNRGLNLSETLEETKVSVHNPKTDKYIHLYAHLASPAEIEQLKITDRVLDSSWIDDEKKDFSEFTKRKELAKKTFRKLVYVDPQDVFRVVNEFKKGGDITLKAAKEFLNSDSDNIRIQVRRLSNPEEIFKAKLRSFNLILLAGVDDLSKLYSK